MAWYAIVLQIVLLVLVSPLVAQETTTSSPVRLRKLHGDEYRQARKARDRADRMRAELESRYRWLPPAIAGTDPAFASDAAQTAAAKVEAAYKEVLQKYPNTEIAAYSGIRLAGFYQYRQEHTKALDQAKDIATQFAGTAYHAKAHFEVGLMYLQGLQNPREAAEWFKKIPKPSDVDVVGPYQYNEAEKLYLSAQKQIAACELAVGTPAYAIRRYRRLAARYPQYRENIERTRRFAQEREMVRRTGLDPASVLEERIESDPLFSGDESEPIAPVAGAHQATQSPDAPDDTQAPVSQQPPTVPHAVPTPRAFVAGVILLCAGIVLCAFGAFSYLHRPKAGKDHTHV